MGGWMVTQTCGYQSEIWPTPGVYIALDFSPAAVCTAPKKQMLDFASFLSLTRLACRHCACPSAGPRPLSQADSPACLHARPLPHRLIQQLYEGAVSSGDTFTLEE